MQRPKITEYKYWANCLKILGNQNLILTDIRYNDMNTEDERIDVVFESDIFILLLMEYPAEEGKKYRCVIRFQNNDDLDIGGTHLVDEDIILCGKFGMYTIRDAMYIVEEITRFVR